MATQTSGTDVATTKDSALGRNFLSLTRISLGLVLFWAFLDKLFALGFATGRDGETGVVDYFGPKAWINGGMPTQGFLKSTSGEFGGEPGGVYGEMFKGWGDFSLGTFRPLDWLFMLALGGLGVALIAGIATKLAAWANAILYVFLFIAAFDNTNNPFIDDHIVYALATVGIVYVEIKYQAIGVGKWWRNLELVKKYNWLV